MSSTDSGGSDHGRLSSDQGRLSLDSLPSEPEPELPQVNGHSHKPSQTITEHGEETHESEETKVSQLEEELRKTREEKEQLASQYRNLLDKLTHMRTTLGNKLKLDAEELDKREQAISALTEKNATQEAKLSTLEMELQDQADRTATLNSELTLLRARNSTIDALESELQQLRGDRERDRFAREEEGRDWERERVSWEREREAWQDRERDWDRIRREETGWKERWEDERDRANRLEGVLEDFGAAKESDIRQATSDLSSRLTEVTQLLAEFKHRAFQAEGKLDTSTTNATRCAQLEKEVKEKNLLIGKLRHEAVIINEHLTEALRRLRKSSSENNVDRRLVTNTLLAFLSTPRADSKRFEMLSLLANVLGWNDMEREKAGLVRGVGGASSVKTPRDKGKGKMIDEKDETESFSKMWVEFLLKEASQPLSPPASTPSLPSASSTPTSSFFPIHSSPSTPSDTLSPGTSRVNLPRLGSISSLPSLGNGAGLRNGTPEGNGKATPPGA